VAFVTIIGGTHTYPTPTIDTGYDFTDGLWAFFTVSQGGRRACLTGLRGACAVAEADGAVRMTPFAQELLDPAGNSAIMGCRLFSGC
jgi:hypothetical protein